MRPPVALHLRRLYRATFLFGMACGISIALTSIHLDARGYSKQDIGTLAAFFASGIAVFAIPVGALIRRYSGKHTLLTAMVGYAICVSLFPFLPSYASIAAVRFLDGACSAGIWVSSETILLSQAEKEHKAYLTSLYAIWLASGYVLGPVLAKGLTAFLPLSAAFVIAGVFAVISATYILLRVPVDRQPEKASEAAGGASSDGGQRSALQILWRIKTSCFGNYAYGYFQASVVLFLPLFLMESKGIRREDTIILPGLFCFGMLTCSSLMGRIADRIGHLKMMRILSTGGLLCVLGFVFLDNYWIMCAAVVGAGATLASMSPVSLALQGVVTDPRDYNRANAIYNVFYAAGMLMGPPITSAVFQRWGGAQMLFHLAALWAAFVLFTIAFMHDDPAARKASDEAAPLPAGS